MAHPPAGRGLKRPGPITPFETDEPACHRLLWESFAVDLFERRGDVYAPKNTRYNHWYDQVHGATYRDLNDPADWDRSPAINAPGHSGQPGSPRFAALAPLGARGDHALPAFTRPMVEAVTRQLLTLRPPGQ